MNQDQIPTAFHLFLTANESYVENDLNGLDLLQQLNYVGFRHQLNSVQMAVAFLDSSH